MKVSSYYQKNFEKLEEHEKQTAKELKKFLERGGVPTIIVFSVNANGDSRKMTFLWNNKGKIERLNANLIRKIMGEKTSEKWNFIVKGCGMDMKLHLLQVVQSALDVKNLHQNFESVSFNQ